MLITGFTPLAAGGAFSLRFLTSSGQSTTNSHSEADDVFRTPLGTSPSCNRPSRSGLLDRSGDRRTSPESEGAWTLPPPNAGCAPAVPRSQPRDRSPPPLLSHRWRRHLEHDAGLRQTGTPGCLGRPCVFPPGHSDAVGPRGSTSAPRAEHQERRASIPFGFDRPRRAGLDLSTEGQYRRT